MTAGVSMDHAERARALFRLGYNCAQSVFCAFCLCVCVCSVTQLCLTLRPHGL